MKKIIVTSLALLAMPVAFASTASTQPQSPSPSENAGTGFYVGAAAGYDEENAVSTFKWSNGSSSKTGAAASVNVGYQFSPRFALEFGATALSMRQNGEGSDALTDLVVKGIYPFANGFNLFGKAGIAILTANISDNSEGSNFTNEAVYLGQGVGYSFNQHWEMTLEGDSMLGGKHVNVLFGQLGAIYHF